MSLSYQDSLRSTRMSDIVTAIGSTGALEVYASAPTGKTSGTFNADPATKLVTLSLSATPGTVSAGILTFNAIASATAIATGTPLSFRIKTTAGGGVSTVVVEGDAAVGSGSLNFNSSITSGGTVSITSASITEGNG